MLGDLGRQDEAEVWFTRSDVATAALSSGDEADDLEIEVFEEEGEATDGEVEESSELSGTSDE